MIAAARKSGETGTTAPSQKAASRRHAGNKTKTSPDIHRPFDESLLAGMTGRLVETAILEKISETLGMALIEPFINMIGKSSGIPFTVRYTGIETGHLATLMDKPAANAAFCIADTTPWYSHSIAAIDGSLIIGFVERLLGGDSDIVPDTSGRALSAIEYDVSSVLFESFIKAFSSLVLEPADIKTKLAKPRGKSDLGERDLPADDYAVALVWAIAFGQNTASLRLIVPQNILRRSALKTQEDKDKAPKTRPEWASGLSSQLSHSSVTLKASIALEPITLGHLRRLKVGDILPFDDEEGLNVLLQANEKNLFWCDFGRSGEDFCVRVREPHGLKKDLISEILR